MAMLSASHTAYFDASGNRRETVVTVCGFVSDVLKWKKFDDEWKALLAAESLTRFHMTEFIARKRPYDKLAEDPGRRDRFFRSLVNTAIRRTNKSFACMVPMNAYTSANKVYQLDEFFGGPYPFAGVGCFVKLKKWADRNHPKRLEVYFEDGDEGKGALYSFLSNKFDVRPQFKAKIDLRPFDAADLVAWECAKFIKTAQAPISEYVGLRASLLELDRHPNDWGVADREDIIQTCKNLGVPRRSKNAVSSNQ